MQRTWMSWCLAIVAASGIAAAEPADKAVPARLKQAKVAAPGEALVIGSINYTVEGKPKKCQTFLIHDCWLVILPPEGSKAMAYAIDGDGQQFRWSLPPGEYEIIGFEHAEGGILAQPVRTVFTVPASLGTIYIGKLLYWAGKQRDVVGIRPEPASDEVLPPGTVKASMMPETQPGTYSSMSSACLPEWELTCAKNMSGVTPISPAEFRNFKPVDSLRPVLQWTPPKAAGLTYDVILFEAAGYKGVRDMLTTYIPGRMVGYQQGLTAPQWQPERPLKPGQRYFWTVRLRRDQKVSNWSTYSYFNFFLIGFSSGYGLLFDFVTPAQGEAK